MRTRRLLRSIMSSIGVVILSPLYLILAVLWLLLIPLRAVVVLVRMVAKRQEICR